MELRKQLGQRLRKLRAAAGLSQDDLAHLAGLSRISVGSIERGSSSLTIDTLDKLAAALDVSLAELLDFHRPDVAPRLDPVAAHVLALMRRGSREDLRRFERIARAYFRPAR
ncbi:MAG TPA: helix-turn-helix transcriptional regulator [Planctomycetota bacterium]|nr:helix-turn-helix transcriptional regulator [Planctomycetota bacterium]